MNQPDGLGLDFEALERAGGVTLGEKQRTRLDAAVAMLRMPPRWWGLSAKELTRTLRAGIRGGERFLKLLDLWLKIGAWEWNIVELSRKDEVQEKMAPGVVAISKLRDQAAKLLPIFREFEGQWQGKPGRPHRGPLAIFMHMADRAFREAGGRGPSYRYMYVREDEDSEEQYAGAALDFFEELLRQVGCTRYTTRTSLAQAILDVRHLTAAKTPDTQPL